LAPALQGWALIREGKPAEGIVLVKAALLFVSRVAASSHPSDKASLAEVMALTGDLDNALLELDTAIAQIERPGWEERFFYAEALRLRGWVLSLKGELEGAEQNYLASLDWAGRQRAKMWELRTATSLARLWQSQGRRQEAYELLAPVYDWFTEGFDTKELLEAKALLDELVAADGAANSTAPSGFTPQSNPPRAPSYGH
jgi:predicted ATPase